MDIAAAHVLEVPCALPPSAWDVLHDEPSGDEPAPPAPKPAPPADDDALRALIAGMVRQDERALQTL